MLDRWLASPLSPRRSVAARAAALWLIVLILVPFTAPFATCDPISLDARHAQLQTQDKAASALAQPVSLPAGGLPSLSGAIVRLHVNRDRPRQPHELLVLRV